MNMPYVNVKLTQKLTHEQMLEVKSGIAAEIVLIPNKTEAVLMVDIEDGKTIFFRGEQMENGAFVDVKMYGTCDFEAKAAFTRAIYKLFGQVLDIAENQMFITLLEYDTWGTSGNLK